MKNGYVWEQAYQDAILETDNGKLRVRIDDARKAINARFREIVEAGEGGQERQAIDAALHCLRVVWTERCSSDGFQQSVDTFHKQSGL